MTIDNNCTAERWRTLSSPDTRPCSPSRRRGPAGPAASGRAVRSAMRPATVCGGAGPPPSTGDGTDGDACVTVVLSDVVAAVGAALVGRSSSAVVRTARPLTPTATTAVAMATPTRRRLGREAVTARSRCRTRARIRAERGVQASLAGDPVRAVRQGRLDGPLPPSPRAQVHQPVEDVRLVPGQQGSGGLPLDEVGQQVLLRVRRPREAVDEVLHVLGSGGPRWRTTPRSAAAGGGGGGGGGGLFGGSPLRPQG